VCGGCHSSCTSEKNQFDKEKRGWDGKQEKQFLTAMAWKRGELDMGGTFYHPVAAPRLA
jgi:hypothetical protein